MNNIQSIQSVTVRDFMGIVSATIDCAGLHMVVVGGKNGAGKSSFLNAISEIFDPKGSTRTPKPIRDGQDSAEVEVITDRAILTRMWKKNDGGTLKVTALDGAVYSSPGAKVKAWTGAAPVDPFAFVGLPDSKQRAELLSRVKLDIDLPATEAAHEAAKEARKLAKRDADQSAAHAASLPDGTPGELVDTAKVAGELQAALDSIREHDTALQGIEAHRAQLDEVQRKIKELQDQHKWHETQIQTAETAAAGWVEPDVDGTRAKLDTAETVNAGVRAAEAKAAAVARADVLAADAAKAEAAVAAIVKTKNDALARASFPAGLTVTDDGIAVEGVPFKQVNTAQQTKVALDLALPEHDAPEIRIAMVKDGSLLDDDSLAHVAELAEQRGYFVIVERVGEDPNATAIFREGQLV